MHEDKLTHNSVEVELEKTFVNPPIDITEPKIDESPMSQEVNDGK